MKGLNLIDIIVQTFILGAVVLASIGILLTGSVESIGFVAMYGAVFLGPWQLVSSLITYLSKGLFLKWRLIHLISSIVYLVVASLLAAYSNVIRFNNSINFVAGFMGFAIPVVLAGFYYFITVKSFQVTRVKSVSI